MTTPQQKQQDRWVGHDPFHCDAAAVPTVRCSCHPWECRNCGQSYGEDEGHTCPVREVLP